mmetsp:Transcript_19155/g.26569  ORF Transcript_19155/g.26569 Transcript_19155/m.26569 type:complete len:171 (+) Transcript_19155:323-835(+)
MILAIVFEIMIICCKSVGRKVPTNYIILFLFTLCESIAVAFICSWYETSIVVSATGMTAGVTLALTFYAMKTKTDFTIMGGLIWICAMVLLMLSLCGFFFHFGQTWHLLVAGISVVLFGIFLIYDVQLVSGKGHHKLSLDDYVIGALIIYVDIIGIFLELLKIFAAASSD